MRTQLSNPYNEALHASVKSSVKFPCLWHTSLGFSAIGHTVRSHCARTSFDITLCFIYYYCVRVCNCRAIVVVGAHSLYYWWRSIAAIVTFLCVSVCTYFVSFPRIVRPRKVPTPAPSCVVSSSRLFAQHFLFADDDDGREVCPTAKSP